MARASKTGGRKAKAEAKAKAKARKASPANGRKAAKKEAGQKRVKASTRKTTGSVQAKLALKTRELNEALARQSASAEILRVIASSPAVQPVFDAIVRTAVRLLGCDRAFFMRVDGNV